ncbi:MAG: lipopolysaccharide heptosyltransferase II [candidate division Zixibacteria bacterium]|nr:lipopolysaccharide heptosyltransferase II [candidate division Zixibacteria bacterium]
MSVKILIRTPNHLGDCLMALPMINETREAYSGSMVSILAPEPLACLFENNPAIDRILSIPASHVHGLLAVLKIRDIIASQRFDVGYILPPSFGAAAGFKLAGIGKRIGYIADGRRLLLSRPLPLPTPLNSTHRSETYFNLLRRGAGADLEFVRPKLFLNEQDIIEGSDILTRFHITESDQYAALAVRAVAESRRWGSEKYAELIKLLVSDYRLKVVLVGSAQDIREGEQIASATGARDVINLAGRTNLREAGAILSRARIFIGNDSGPAHLAAAVGVPLVVLSGADDPKETSPLSPRKRVIYLEHLGCISCVKNVCSLKGDRHMQCMKNITVDMVATAVEELLSQND